MRILFLLLLPFLFIGCGSSDGVTTSPDAANIESEMQCHDNPSLAINCAYDCESEYFIKDTGVMNTGIRSYYETMSDCSANINVVQEEPINWISPGR